jgi:hypothetical protein
MLKTKSSQFLTGNSSATNFFDSLDRLKSTNASESLQLYAQVSQTGYYKINHQKISFRGDTIVNFTLSAVNDLPFKTAGDYLAFWDDKSLSYKQLFLKGINLGTSPPGFQPGEIGYAIQSDQYERWINRMGQLGFNSLRIYTLHPPVFYEKLAEYNESHPDKPIYLFQGIWLEDDTAGTSHDLYRFSAGFDSNAEEVISCIHGSRTIPERLGRAYGIYKTDVSQWVMGYITGREISSFEVRNTNNIHPTTISFTGNYLSLTNASPTETWLAARLDHVISYEKNNFHQERPVSASSWPTLDPLIHPTEPYDTDEDNASFDLGNLNLQKAPGGYFASFHAYPYFPNFMNEDPDYRKSSDSYGPNSYLGYLKDLKNHYKNIPLVIAEFGVPSSWGSAHQSFSGMHHGGHTEEMQGEYDVRMIKNIRDVNCAGGMMFSWMDEWFKPTWIVSLLESRGFYKNGETEITPTRQQWLNLCSAEQNFGLIAFDPSDPHEFLPYSLDVSNGFVSAVKASYDDHFFQMEIDLPTAIKATDTLWVAFDTYRSNLGESILPNKTTVTNRAEFSLLIPASADTASYFVTQTYDEFGLTERYNDADTLKQLFKSVATDGKPWDLMRWKNSSNPDAIQNIGRILMKGLGSTITTTNLHGVFVEPRKISVRIPWTMLYFTDPTRLEVINGFVSYNQGWGHIPIHAISDGIAVSVSNGKAVVNSTSRYTWPEWWNILHNHSEREKASVGVIQKGLSEIVDIQNP